MTSAKFFNTVDIALAVCIVLVTGQEPLVKRSPGQKLASFEFYDCEPLRQVVDEYSAGVITLNIRDFDATRRGLFRRISAWNGGNNL